MRLTLLSQIGFRVLVESYWLSKASHFLAFKYFKHASIVAYDNCGLTIHFEMLRIRKYISERFNILSGFSIEVSVIVLKLNDKSNCKIFGKKLQFRFANVNSCCGHHK